MSTAWQLLVLVQFKLSLYCFWLVSLHNIVWKFNPRSVVSFPYLYIYSADDSHISHHLCIKTQSHYSYFCVLLRYLILVPGETLDRHWEKLSTQHTNQGPGCKLMITTIHRVKRVHLCQWYSDSVSALQLNSWGAAGHPHSPHHADHCHLPHSDVCPGLA